MGVCALPVVVSQLPPCLVLGFGRGADEGTGVPILSQDPGEMVFFLPQVVLRSGDGSGSVEQAHMVSMLSYVRYSWQPHRFHFSTGNSSVDNS